MQALVLLLAMLAAERAPAPDQDFVLASVPGVAGAATPTMTFTAKPFPPPGTAADQQLLKELLQAQAGVASERSIAVRTTQRLAAAGFDARLAALQAAQRAPESEQTAALRTRLATSWDRVAELMHAPWPVDPRLGCRQEGIELEVLMPDPPASPRLASARENARACLGREQLPLRALEVANRDLLTTVEGVKAALPPTPRADPKPTLEPPAAATTQGR